MHNTELAAEQGLITRKSLVCTPLKRHRGAVACDSQDSTGQYTRYVGLRKFALQDHSLHVRRLGKRLCPIPI